MIFYLNEIKLGWFRGERHAQLEGGVPRAGVQPAVGVVPRNDDRTAQSRERRRRSGWRIRRDLAAPLVRIGPNVGGGCGVDDRNIPRPEMQFLFKIAGSVCTLRHCLSTARSCCMLPCTFPLAGWQNYTYHSAQSSSILK